MAEFSHLDPTGAARMVDVSGKQVTLRTASARGRVRLSAECVTALREQTIGKGDVIAVARVAGIMAAKRTGELIPLCHPLPIDAVEVELVITDDGVDLAATVRTAGRTGVEMEALTAVSVAGLTVIDMIKSVDRRAELTDIAVTAKSGGRSGDWRR